MPATRNTWLKDYFTFTKKERRAVIVLAVLAVFFCLLPTLFPFLVKGDSEIVIDKETQAKLAAMKTEEKGPSKQYDDEDRNTDWYQPKQNAYPSKDSYTKGELFYFDPNTATADEWKRLGVKEKTIQTILNYRHKGGKFRKAEDISRIYGLSPKDAERLLPYAQIKTETSPSYATSSPVPVNSAPSTEVKPIIKESKSKPVDINLADTTEWKTLKGIGSFYARKIVNFRNKLGGFATVEQVGETFGLPDSTYQAIKPYLQNNHPVLKQININTASVDEFKAHPYIKYGLANAIVQYRTQHGEFKSVSDLNNIGAVDEAIYKKIAPYLTVK
ncbi:MAG: helix-hairpin-helix domain-containing protein [Chitinophagaceae bacterium]|nr:helix-hairpin-helix domain-containing protein [Chitinophagaceae bacterium]